MMEAYEMTYREPAGVRSAPIEEVGTELRLPGMFCPDCRAYPPSPFYAKATRLPILPTSELSALIEYYKARAVSAEGGSYLLPEDFSILAEQVRQLLLVPPQYRVRPHIGIGQTRIRLTKYPPKWDICGLGPYTGLYLTPHAANLLLHSGLTGFDIHPVLVLNRSYSLYQGAELYEMVVWGNGGVPYTEPADCWWQCKRCGRWQLRCLQIRRMEIDPTSWDGSDFFHFVGYGGLMVTQRAREWLESAGLHLWVGFIEPRAEWYLDRESRDAARASRSPGTGRMGMSGFLRLGCIMWAPVNMTPAPPAGCRETRLMPPPATRTCIGIAGTTR